MGKYIALADDRAAPVAQGGGLPLAETAPGAAVGRKIINIKNLDNMCIGEQGELIFICPNCKNETIIEHPRVFTCSCSKKYRIH